MKYIRLIPVLIAILMLLCACPHKEDGHSYITLVNRSDRAIVYQERLMRIGEIDDEQYDCRYLIWGIQENSTYQLYCDDRGTAWEAALDTYYLQLKIMDDETFGEYIEEPCEIRREKVPILYTYRLTVSDLEQMNWTVVFPPEEHGK